MDTIGAVTVETRRRTCLIVASPGADVSVIRRLLQDKGVDSLTPSDVPPTGVTILDQWGKALSQADLVLFVLTSSQANAGLYFEIGLALGQGKQLMVVAPDNVEGVPADIRELLVVRAELDDDEALGFSLDQFLAAPRSNGRKAAASSIGGRPLGGMADALIERATALRSRAAYQSADAAAQQEFEQIMMAALQASHVAPVVAAPAVPSRERDNRVDLAAWVDELDSLGLNPLLIELKVRLVSTEEINSVVEQVHRYLQGYRAQAILILYMVGPHVGEITPSLPNNIVLLDFIDLLNRMRTRSFGSVLRTAFYDSAAANIA